MSFGHTSWFYKLVILLNRFQLGWLKILNEKKEILPRGFAGIILTGWQRFDHFASLCELLPVGIPSLCCCLAALQAQTFGNAEVENCSMELGFDLGTELRGQETSIPATVPTFPGSSVYFLVKRFTSLQVAFKNLKKSDTLTTWFSDYSLQRGRVSPLQLDCIRNNFQNLLLQFREIECALQSALTEIYPTPVCNEWLGTYLTPIVVELSRNVEKANMAVYQK